MSKDDKTLDVGVVGGGVIGLTSAYYLSKKGYSVGIFEKNYCLACEASKWNAGLVVPSMYHPLPLSASLLEVLKWISSRRSPVKASLRTINVKWVVEMLKARRRLARVEYWRELRKMWREAIDSMESLISEAGIECDARKGNIIEVYSDEKLFEKALEESKLLREDGVKFEVLDSKSLIEREPALSKRVVGGIMYTSDLQLDPEKFSEGLAKHLENLGVRTFTNAEVRQVEVGGRDQVYIRSSIGDFKAKNVVLACGPWTSKILRKLGLNVLIEPARGYTIRLKPTSTSLRSSLMLEEFRVVASPLANGGTRISGVLDLTGYTLTNVEGRVRVILEEASKLLPYISKAEIEDVHSALRPCTPDGIPIIGRHPRYTNIIIASGHCRFGLTFSTLTGRLVEKLVSGEELPENLAFLKPQRISSG